jgi:hypothetical protein
VRDWVALLLGAEQRVKLVANTGAQRSHSTKLYAASVGGLTIGLSPLRPMSTIGDGKSCSMSSCGLDADHMMTLFPAKIARVIEQHFRFTTSGEREISEWMAQTAWVISSAS